MLMRPSFQAIADALEVALYIHSAGIGTEIIHGKGLNHYGINLFFFLLKNR